MTAALASGQDDITGIFARTPRTSIDYAVMEHAPKVAVVRAEFAWNDVGGFGALESLAVADDDGNHALLTGDSTLLPLGSRDNLVYAEGGRAVSLFGVEGLVVVDTGDALMICPRDRAEELRQLVEHVRRAGREDLL
jgi:mannose-1-phosphate guanylyltransferase